MKESLQLRNINSILSVLGLAFLLLLSPCKVRNFIQVELGIPQTKSLNKNQSTISPSNCPTLEVSETIQTISELDIQQFDFSFSEAICFDFTITLFSNSLIQGSSRRPFVSVVPLYILYQNIQVYS